jgi:hypothetical protein
MCSWLKAGGCVPKQARPTLNYPADLVWAAACAAYRVNGGYFKQAEFTDQGQITRPANRDLVRLYCVDTSLGFITDRDRDQGCKCRQDLVNAATMSALKNQATEWTLLTAEMAALEAITTDYQLSVITAMPKSHTQTLARESTDGRLAYCETEPVGTDNQLITVQGEVIRSNYSAKWNTFYVTMITDTNHQVFFAYREGLEPGRLVKLRGRVKRHADRATQLSRVKLEKQEAV